MFQTRILAALLMVGNFSSYAFASDAEHPVHIVLSPELHLCMDASPTDKGETPLANKKSMREIAGAELTAIRILSYAKEFHDFDEARAYLEKKLQEYADNTARKVFWAEKTGTPEILAKLVYSNGQIGELEIDGGVETYACLRDANGRITWMRGFAKQGKR